MTGRRFLDTNILVYTDAADQPARQAVAIDLVARCRRDGTGVVSTQVLNEYFVTTTRKLGVDPVVARRKVELFGQLTTVPTALDDIIAAIDLHRLHGLHYWDALVIRSAQQAGCVELFTEDMQDERRFEGLTIINPFLVR